MYSKIRNMVTLLNNIIIYIIQLTVMCVLYRYIKFNRWENCKGGGKFWHWMLLSIIREIKNRFQDLDL